MQILYAKVLVDTSSGSKGMHAIFQKYFFENILKKGRWLRTIITLIKLLEKALTGMIFINFDI